MIEIMIRFDPANGALQITAPLQNPVLCGGVLLEAIRILHREANKRDENPSRIMPARIMPGNGGPA